MQNKILTIESTQYIYIYVYYVTGKVESQALYTMTGTVYTVQCSISKGKVGIS